MSKKLAIQLVVRDDGSVTIDRVSGKLGALGDEANNANRKTKSLKAALSDLGRDGGQALLSLSKYAIGIATAVTGASAAVVAIGVRNNALLEQSRLGIAALVSGMGEITDANGRVLQGQERWNASLGISESVIKKLRVAGLQTTAEFEDLVRVLQEGLGPALQAGFDEGQVVEFVKAIALTGGALGIQGDRLGQEIRALLAGERGPDNQIANALFGDEKDIKAKLDVLRESGELFDWLMGKMASFSKAGELAADTFDGALSNFKDAITQALGEATESATSGFTLALKDLTAEIVTFDEAGNAIFNDDFISGVRQLGDAFLYLSGKSVEAVKGLPDTVTHLKATALALRELGTLLATPAAPLVILFGPERVKQIEDQIKLAEKIGELADEETRRRENTAIFGALREEMFGRFGEAPVVSSDFMEAFRDADGSLEAKIKAIRAAMSEGVVTAESFGEALAAVGGKLSGKAGGTGADDDAAAKLQEGLADYERWFDEFSSKAAAKGDPLAEALAKIETDRIAAIAKIEDANKKLKGALSGRIEGDTAAVGQAAEAAAQRAVFDAMNRSLGDLVKEQSTHYETAADVRVEIQRAAEERRLEVIEDAIEREFQMALAANEEYRKQSIAKVEADIEDEEAKAAIIAEIDAEKAARDEKADEERQRARDRDLTHTTAWAQKTRQAVKEALGNIADDMTELTVGSVNAFRGAIDGLFQGLFDGDLDFASAFEGLFDDLQSMWSKMFSNMIARAASGTATIGEQLKQMWDALNDPKAGGLDKLLQGAGIGSVIGGIGAAILGDDTYAAEGGSIGGAIGALIGNAVGAVVGSVIGSIVGGLIDKSKDWIRVAIEDGVVTVSHDGLGDEANGARARLQRDVSKFVYERVKSWESILDLFPEEVRASLDDLVGPLNLDEILGDIGDVKGSNAFAALGDFFGETLNQELYDSYLPAIMEGLSSLGVSDQRIVQQMFEWASLKGEELQGAIRDYITTVVESIRVRDMFSGADVVNAAQVDLINQKPIMRIRSMVTDLDRLVAAIPDLDPSDQIAAMQQVNQLGQQIWDNMLQRVQQIDAAQRAFEDSFAAQSERFQMALMDPQEQANFLTDRINQTMGQLAAASARGDDAEISRLGAVLQQYMEQMFGLGQTEGFDLSAIVEWLETIKRDALGLGITGFGEARDLVVEEQLKAFALLSDAAKALLEASGRFADYDPDAPAPWQPKPGGPLDPNRDIDGFTNAISHATSIVDTIPASFDAAAMAAQHFAWALLGASDDSVQTTSDLARRIKEMLDQMAGVGGGLKAPVSYPGTGPGLPTHATGLDYVPYDGYVASLHRGERVLTANESAALARSGGGGGSRNVNVTVELTGPGADFLRQVGVEVSRTVISNLRARPRLLDPGYDA